ncbi:MAG: hypothetical protein J6S13_02545 [Clostridia bacterium]|nr:hypothetical protein [Clostridia bacterium]
MRKSVLMSVLAGLVSVCLMVALCLTPEISESITLTDVDMPVAAADGTVLLAEKDVLTTANEEAAPTVDTVVYDEDYLKKRFTSMLNINYCYGEGFYDNEQLASAAAVTLSDYAADLPGVGLAVNSVLVEGFVESFYGVELNGDELCFEGVPKSYISAPVGSVATQFHSVQSVTETDEGFEVYSLAEFYYGGDDVEVSVTRSVFVKAPESEFGFHLVSCELA